MQSCLAAILQLNCRRFILTLLTVISIFPFASAYERGQVRRHFIIAVDQALPVKFQELKRSVSTATVLEEIMKESGMQPGDYLSVVPYYFNMQNPNPATMAKVAKIGGETFSWKEIADGHPLKDWQTLTFNASDAAGSIGSMQSIAKEYAIGAVEADNEFADITYLLMLTDNRFQGSDNYKKEWAACSFYNPERYKALEGEVFDYVDTTHDNLKITRKRVREIFKMPGSDPYGVYIYEIEPAAKPGVRALTDIPAQLPFERVRGGYKVTFNATSVNPEYELLGIRVKAGDFDKIYSGGEVDAFINDDEIRVGRDSIIVEADMRFLDHTYGGIRQCAVNPAWRKLMRVSNISSHGAEPKVLGLVALPEKMWPPFTDSIKGAVTVWNWVVGILFTVIVLWIGWTIFRRMTTYKPEDDAVHLRHF